MNNELKRIYRDKIPSRPKCANRFFCNFNFMVGLILLIATISTAVFAPYIARFDVNQPSPKESFTAPNADHWMGTDKLGRDIWSRFVFGGRVSLIIGLTAVVIGLFFGTLMGVLAGFYGGVVDSVISWITEVLMAFPGILLALTIMAVLGAGVNNVILAVGVGSIPQFMRMARSAVLKTREMEYINAARTIGASDARILFRHILPNIYQSVIVLATLGIGGAILEGSSLSYLGLGAQPLTPEWGAMINSGRTFLNNAWWVSVFPGIGVFLAIMSINMLGEGLNQVLDPVNQ